MTLSERLKTAEKKIKKLEEDYASLLERINNTDARTVNVTRPTSDRDHYPYVSR